MSSTLRSITVPRFSIIEVGNAFLIQDAQRRELFVKVEAWEPMRDTQAFREYAYDLCALLNAKAAI